MKKLLSFLPLCLLLALIPTFALSAAAEEPEVIRVACVGDSITDGGADFSEYPANLQKFLDASKYEVKNFGFGGTTAMKKPNVVPSYWDKVQFTDSKSYQPNIVILMLGTNDVVNENWDPDTFKKDLTDLVKDYQNLSSHPTVYLCTPPSAFDAGHPAKLAEYGVPIVKEIAADTGATLVDVNSLTATFKAEGLTDDGIHPNKVGYVRLAQIFYENIFGGTPVTLTVQGEPGMHLVFAGQNPTIGADGTATLTTGDGLKSLKVESAAGYAIVDFTVEGDTLCDLTGIDIPDNLAFYATATDKSGTVTKVNDGDSATNWQREANESYSDVWLQYDFGELTEMAGMEFEWEDTTRPGQGKYKLTYSTDGVTWKNFTGLSIVYGNIIDTVTFDTVSARYVKLDILDGIGGKYRPSLFEWRVRGPVTAFEPAVTTNYVSNPSEGLEFESNGDGTCMVTGIGTCTDTDLVIPARSPAGDAVTAIGWGAFYGCEQLTSVRFPSTLTYISMAGFTNCTSLADIVIPKTVKSIGQGAFWNTAVYNDPANHEDGLVYLGDALLGPVGDEDPIPDEVTVRPGTRIAADFVFEMCENITSLTLPNTLTCLGGGMFNGCENMTIYFLGTEEQWNAIDKTHNEAALEVIPVVFLAPQDVLPGDVDGNGTVEAADLTALARHVGGIELLTGDALAAADVDGNGSVDASDLTKLARIVGGIE